MQSIESISAHSSTTGYESIPQTTVDMVSPMEVFNASQTSFPNTIRATISSEHNGFMSKMLENVSVFSVFLTLFSIAVVYDQSMVRPGYGSTLSS